MKATLGLLLIACITLVPNPVGAAPTGFQHFVTAKGDQLFDGDQPFRFMSFNIPNLHLLEDNFKFLDPNPWRWPNEFEIRDALESIRQMGGQATRIYVLSVRREESDMGEHVYVRAPGEFNEEAFRVLDKVMQIANETGVRVIIPLVDNWKWWGGRAEYARFRGKQPDDFWTDDQIIADFEKTIHFTLNRVNSYTGVAYKDDPAILGWETGNELDSPPAWTRRITAYIKSQDSNHLVIDGYALHGVRQESIDDPNVDVITTHHYPNTDSNYVDAILEAHRTIAGRKPYFVGEFGFASTAELERVMNVIIEKGISGGMLWSLRFHNRDGGFYWHSEPSGENFFKSYHWPGFDSGEMYDERKLLQLARRKAFEIRGLPLPPRSMPAAPRLLPIEDVRAISWQGSTGASQYDVERSTSKDGPWQVVGAGITDAAVQYRPLFADENAATDASYFYRVRATNEAGGSPTSNVVGPVRVTARSYVDRCVDFERVAQRKGDIKLVMRDARKSQEDIHRFQLAPGSSIVYRAKGSIRNWKAYVFHDKGAGEVDVECSADGKAFRPCQFTREGVTVGAGDYGYRRPLLLSGQPDKSDVHYLRLSRPETADEGVLEVARVEVAFDDSPTSKRIGRHTHGATLNPSVLVLHKARHTEGVKSIRRAAALGCRKVCVVVTMLSELDEQYEVQRFGLQRKGKFRPLNDQLLADFRQLLQEVFAEAANQNLELSVLAHLNAGGNIYEWRNHFLFDPLARYGGYSYQQAVIEPIVDALRKTYPTQTRVDLSLAGEMGRSVFAHAKSYQTIMDSLRSDARLPNLEIGMSFNFSEVAGKHVASHAQTQEVQRFVDACDFIGLSNYRWFDLPVTADNFSTAVAEFLTEMRANGVNVPAAMPLHFSEVGIGGGTDNGLARTPAEAAKTPWNGTDDPRRNPWKSGAMRDFRVEYHRALLKFLSQPASTNPVTDAFLWSEGSWDPMDIVDRGFVDLEIIDLIQQHNETVSSE